MVQFQFSFSKGAVPWAVYKAFPAMRRSLKEWKIQSATIYPAAIITPVERRSDQIPTSVQLARELYFESPLDEGIREFVITLAANGVETFESCEGGEGHSFPWPTIRFEGGSSEGLRALSVALENGLPVDALRRTWGIRDRLIHGPWWEMTSLPPKDSRLWAARNTAARYDAQNDAHSTD